MSAYETEEEVAARKAAAESRRARMEAAIAKRRVARDRAELRRENEMLAAVFAEKEPA